MPFCKNCGASLDQGAAFCPSCGTSARAGAAPAGNVAAGAAAATAPPISTPAPVTNVGLQTNVAGALAYILGIVTAVIFLVIDPYKNDRFVRFHAFQSLFFGLAWIVLWIAWIFLWGMLSYASGGVLFWIGIPLRMLIGLAGFVYWLFLLYQAYNNEMYKIPFIGELAAKQAAA
jgi:uncharacterized membrane protein